MKAIAVSENTGKLIECVEKLDQINEAVYNTLEDMFGERQTEKIMNEKFFTQYDSFRNAIYAIISVSINENMSYVGFKEI